MEDVELGRRIRERRTSSGQSLADVARGTGLTESFLSRLERGKTGVTVDTLRRIAAFWDAELIEFLQRSSGPKPLLTRAGRGPSLQLEGNGALNATSETLIPRMNSALQATLYRTPRGGGRFKAFSHPGEEMVYVVKGQVTYYVGSDAYELRAGDSLWHTSDIPHRWECPDCDAVTLHVNTPPAW
ncbi:helix-turn-helix domain-containing protein [Labrys monachus]|uniref:Transcriptional regulator with XRE-family HTH domain n=1 Tax=Labrys monachus TaxID=217067 RepID=A0ABU0FB07_9HYPH|nr:cupin domain-containing protein [Labrys monachus]MDQ0391795.1 transcriptional regulator with XRE-family HTH domain [Labrys monachus]